MISLAAASCMAQTFTSLSESLLIQSCGCLCLGKHLMAEEDQNVAYGNQQSMFRVTAIGN